MIDTISTFIILYDLKFAYRNISKKGCIQEDQQERLTQATIIIIYYRLTG
jgi:hypothetical protein